MKPLRRDFAKLAGGAAAGLLFTPAPWRWLDDSAKWTQNWSWLPKTPRGPVTDTPARCTLCRAACPVRARCAGGVPTGFWPAGEALCPAGFAAHQVAYHPARLRTGTRPVEDIAKALKGRSGRGFAVLDLAPGRTASYAVRDLLGRLPGSIYVEPRAVEGATAAALSQLLSQPASLALDLERLRTLLSVRTPVVEGWASPKRVCARPLPFRLLQADAETTRTSEMAAEWLKVPAGGEQEFLLAVAANLLAETKTALPGCDVLRRAAEKASHPQAARVARELLANRPAAVVADGDPANGPLHPAVVRLAAAINVLLASLDEGGFGFRAEAPLPSGWNPVPVTGLAAVADASLHTLLVDEPLPGCSCDWDAVKRKLAPDALVVAVTWTTAGAARGATDLLAAPVFVEAAQDAAPEVDAARARFAVSRAFLPPPAGSIDMPALLGRLTGEDVTGEQALERRAAAIRAAGEGEVRMPGESGTKPVAAFGKDEEFWAALKGGACWTAAPSKERPAAIRVVPEGTTEEMLLAAGNNGTRTPGWRPAGASPLIAKLWRESGYRAAPGQRLL